MNRALLAGIFIGMVSVVAPDARAYEQMRSARALESGKWAASVYGVHREQKDLEFRLGSSGLVQVPLSNGTTAQLFSSGNTDLLFDGEGDATMAKITWRPFDGLHYIFTAGLGDYELRIPSGAVTNKLENSAPGIIWGMEAGWNILTDTLVTPAVLVSLGYLRSDYDIRRLRSGGSAPVAVSQDFTLEEWQGSVSVSKRWKKLDPYAGLRFFRQNSRLFDTVTAERVRGSRDGFSPYAGLRFEFLGRESVVLEAAFADETVLAAGLAVGF